MFAFFKKKKGFFEVLIYCGYFDFCITRNAANAFKKFWEMRYFAKVLSKILGKPKIIF